MVALVIETGSGLGDEELELAAELGPSEVRAEAELPVLAERADFEVVAREDLTASFEEVLLALWRGLAEAESELRSAEGDVEYDYELGRRRSMMEAVRRGLIRRTMVVARRP